MGATLALLSLLLFAQATPVEFTIVTVPIDSRFDLPLSPAGEVEVRLDETVSRLKVKVERIQPFAAFGPLLRSYVVWAVTPEGEFENVGELEVDRQKAELETATTLQRFGILITAEPHFMVDRPSSAVAFTSRPPRHDEIRVESSSVETGFTNYSQISLPPQGALPPRITQARMAFKVAEGEGAEKLADAAFRQARVAVDSMEQLLRRNMPLEVLLPYANDAIRLAHRATKLARAQPMIDELNEVTGRADALERERQRLEQEVQRITQRRRDTEERLDQTRSELVAAEREGRQLDLEKEEALRRGSFSRIGSSPARAAVAAAGARSDRKRRATDSARSARHPLGQPLRPQQGNTETGNAGDAGQIRRSDHFHPDTDDPDRRPHGRFGTGG